MRDGALPRPLAPVSATACPRSFFFFSTEKKRVKREGQEKRRKKEKASKEALIGSTSALLQQAGVSSISLPASVKSCYIFSLIFKVGSNYLSCLLIDQKVRVVL